MEPLKLELDKLDRQIEERSQELKRLKKARRQLGKALEQLNLNI